MSVEREIEEIEAILREHLRFVRGAVLSGPLGQGIKVSHVGGIPEAAAAIAALRSRDREDGAREAGLPQGWVAVPKRPTFAMKAAIAHATGGSFDIGHYAYECVLAVAPALPLSPVRTEAPDA